MRLTKKVFHDLAIWMIGLGLLMGIVFPFFLLIMGIPSELVLRPWFFIACMSAGFIVGAANIILAKAVVGIRLRVLAERMYIVEKNLEQMALGGNIEDCAPEDCLIEVDSDDDIGKSSQGFNQLVEALANFHRANASTREFNKVLASNLEIDVLADLALHQLLKHIGADAGAVFIESSGEIQLAAMHGIHSAETLSQNNLVRLGFLDGRGQIITVPDDIVLEGVLTEFRPRKVLLQPITYKNVVISLVILAAAEDFHQYSTSQLDLFRQSMAFAFNNALTHERLQRLAALDPLTGAYNRRFGLARLHEEFTRAVRQESPLGVLMFDIDHFKKVNDTYGHLAGDRVLTLITKLTGSVIREGDILVRYGGEEFLVILPAASKEDGAQIAERFRRKTEETLFKEGEQEIRVTVSVGVTAYPELNAENESDLVAAADKALYIAKDSGRNRVVVG